MKPPIQILRIYRAISYFLNYLIFELPRGLNISPRSKSTGITLQGNHGYALTSRSALKNMLNGIDLKNKSFLDIGSGKGGGDYLFSRIGLCKFRWNRIRKVSS